MQEAPEFQSSFVSPRTRNTTTPGLSAERVLGVDASYNLRYGDFAARISGYYTRIYDQSKVISYYDDVAATFTNFAMSGIDKVHFGLEAAVSIPIYHTPALERRELGTIYLRFEPLLPANAGQQRRYRLRRLCLLEGFPGREH